MVIITYLNIIFVILKLLYFLTNLNPIHIQMVNKVINYLLGTRILKLKFGGGDKLKIIINASFTDNISDRKSLQGYTMHLFRGLIA